MFLFPSTFLSNKFSLKPKIFIIGFNKCGTKTLHHFFKSNGLRSAHHIIEFGSWNKKIRVNIAAKMNENLRQGAPVLHLMEDFNVYSDMIAVEESHVIEGSLYFKNFFEEYSNAYFIFNDRPIENWLRSRSKHVSGENGKLHFLERYSRAIGVCHHEMQDIWRDLYLDHKRNVLEFFKNSEKFVVFNIEKDGPEKLVDFLKFDYKLKPSKWRHRGSSASRGR